MKFDFKKLDEIVKIIGNNYFVDSSQETVGKQPIEFWKILMGAFSYLGNKNSLLLGNPGSGKTTYSGVISSIMSGLPYDLFDNEKIQGHPDQTKDTMLARADLGRIAEEGVVWQAPLYLPALTLDELNRLPPGKQSIFLEFIRTGSVEHLGKLFARPKTPIFATMNYNGTGTYPVPIPSLDRFDVSIEFEAGPGWIQDQIAKASDKINKDLKNPELTQQIVAKVLDKQGSLKEKLDFINLRAEEGRKSRKDIPAIQTLPELEALPISPDAKTYLQCVWDEINRSYLFGENRGVDPRDKSSHSTEFSCHKVKAGISNRYWQSITFYSNMLARFLGQDRIEIEHVNAVAPYCLAHRVEFDADFAAKTAEAPRLKGERQEQDLSRRMLKDIKTNYDKNSDSIKALDLYLANPAKASEALKVQVKEIIAGPTPDHPTLREFYKLAKGE